MNQKVIVVAAVAVAAGFVAAVIGLIVCAVTGHDPGTLPTIATATMTGLLGIAVGPGVKAAGQ